MICQPPLYKAFFLRRYKRFLADVRTPSGSVITLHCPNTGSMRNCLVEDSDCWYSISDNPKRKYSGTWEVATTASGHMAGINTARANALVKEAIEFGIIRELQRYQELRPEVKYGRESSRVDFLLSAPDRPDCYVEVKNVTFGMESGLGLFPDAVSERGSRHLRELISMRAQGKRAVLLFCVQHTGIEQVAPADKIDPVYGSLLRDAAAQGVEIIAYGCEISERAIALKYPLSVDLS
ncbi:MAG: sugar fermentation stimulation protein A [Cellvibrionaceae bacterium]|jgi:sugar fermentation stimulation protein A